MVKLSLSNILFTLEKPLKELSDLEEPLLKTKFLGKKVPLTLVVNGWKVTPPPYSGGHYTTLKRHKISLVS